MEPPSITQFFANELGAPLANPRWSWGSWHEATNRIFLRVWAHDHIEAQDQAQMVRLLREDWTRTSAGYNERARHIESIRSGAEAFGVVATAAPRGAGHIRIQSYDSRSLVRLGALVRWEKDPTSVFALIGPSVPVTQIGTQTRSVGGEAADIAELIARRDLEETNAPSCPHRCAFGSRKIPAPTVGQMGQRLCRHRHLCARGTASISYKAVGKKYRPTTTRPRQWAPISGHLGCPL